MREDPQAARQLVKSGERLAAAQSAALRGGGGGKLREAAGAQQDAIEVMVGAVRAGPGGTTLSPAVLDRVRETLRAVAGDEALARELEAGRIAADHEALGLAGERLKPSQARREKARPASRAAAKRDPRAAKDTQRAAKVEREAKRALDSAVKRARQAAGRLERAQAGLDRAQAQLDEARGRLDEAEHEREARETELAEAREAHAQAKRS